MEYNKYEKFSDDEGFVESKDQYDRELEAMFSDTGWDLNNSSAEDMEDVKVYRMEAPSKEEWEAMGERAIAQNMDALRDDYEDKGLSEIEISSAVASDYEEAREEFYSDMNEGQDLE